LNHARRNQEIASADRQIEIIARKTGELPVKSCYCST
jgi:geranylgeranyl pyrophosphate synthase